MTILGFVVIMAYAKLLQLVALPKKVFCYLISMRSCTVSSTVGSTDIGAVLRKS
jgi:hypothetical protein